MTGSRHFLRRAAPLLIAALLAACGKSSAELTAKYSRDIAGLRQAGMARSDSAPADAPWGPEDLARNFARVVHAQDHRRFDEQPLQKWRQPARYRFLYGDAGPTDEERRHMADLARRLSAATGLSVREVDEDAGEEANLNILFLDYEEREAILAPLTPEERENMVYSLMAETHGDDANLCMFDVAFDVDDPEKWTRYAVTVIRSELPRDWRMSCLDEEVAQMFGPQYDHDDVRPSMFNDDEEFLYLTDHDAAMLRLIYDPRLRSGMTRAQTTPIVRRILAEGGFGPAPGS